MILGLRGCFSRHCGHSAADEQIVEGELREDDNWVSLRVHNAGHWCDQQASSFCETEHVDCDAKDAVSRYGHYLDDQVTDDLPEVVRNLRYPPAQQQAGFVQAHSTFPEYEEEVVGEECETPAGKSLCESDLTGETSCHSVKPLLPGSVTECSSAKSEFSQSPRNGTVHNAATSMTQRGMTTNDVPEFPKLDQQTDGSLPFDTVKCSSLSAFSPRHVTHRKEDSARGTPAGEEDSGRGKLARQDGSLYEGEISDGKAHGEGVLHHSSGSFYEGQFADDKPCGQGMRRCRDGQIYEGQWLDGEHHGAGIERSPRGTRFEGQFLHGQKSGHGNVLFRDGATYLGQFQDSMMHGEGKYTYRVEGCHHFYDGMWSKGKQDGLGTYGDSKTGQMRQGEWENGMLVKWLSVITTMEYHDPEDEEEFQQEAWTTKAAQGAGAVAQRARGGFGAVAAAGGAVAPVLGRVGSGVVGATGGAVAMVGGAVSMLRQSSGTASSLTRGPDDEDETDSERESDGEQELLVSDKDAIPESPGNGMFIESSGIGLRVQEPQTKPSAICASPQHDQMSARPLLEFDPCEE